MPLPFIKFWNSFYRMCTIKSIGKCVKNYQRMRFKQNIKYLLRSKITEIMPLTWNYASAPHPPPENYSTANVWKLRPPPPENYSGSAPEPFVVYYKNVEKRPAKCLCCILKVRHKSDICCPKSKYIQVIVQDDKYLLIQDSCFFQLFLVYGTEKEIFVSAHVWFRVILNFKKFYSKKPWITVFVRLYVSVISGEKYVNGFGIYI